MNRNRRVQIAAAALLGLTTLGCALYSGFGATAAPGAGAKVLYLTFDDGPGDETVEVLDVLSDNDATAVFFALGQELAEETSLGRRIVAEGHVLANHTWGHANLVGLDPAARDDELGQTGKLLGQLGSDSTCVRPPYGASDAAVAADLEARGMSQVLWNVDTEDWTRPGTEAITERLLAAESGDVILLHDGGSDRSQTVAALREALPRLAAAGFTFDAVPGC